MVAYTQDNGELDWVDPRQPLESVLACYAQMASQRRSQQNWSSICLQIQTIPDPMPLKGQHPRHELEQQGIQYCMADDLFDCDAFLNDVRIASELQGVPLTTLHGEFSPGQWEINTLASARRQWLLALTRSCSGAL